MIPVPTVSMPVFQAVPLRFIPQFHHRSVQSREQYVASRMHQKKVLEVKNNSTNDITIKKICATTGWLCDYEVKNLNYVLKKNNSSPAYVNTEILNRYCASGIPGNQPFTMKVFFTIGNSSTQYSIENRVDCVRPTQIMTFSP